MTSDARNLKRKFTDEEWADVYQQVREHERKLTDDEWEEVQRQAKKHKNDSARFGELNELLLGEHDHYEIEEQVKCTDMSAFIDFPIRDTPLSLACQLQCQPCVKLFLSKGASAVEALCYMNEGSSTPKVEKDACKDLVQKAYEKRRNEIMQLMYKHAHEHFPRQEMRSWKRFDLSLFNYALKLGCRECVSACLPLGENPDKAMKEAQVMELAKTNPRIHVPSVVKLYTEQQISLDECVEKWERINVLKSQMGEVPCCLDMLQFCEEFMVVNQLKVEDVVAKYKTVRRDVTSVVPRLDVEAVDLHVAEAMKKGLAGEQAKADAQGTATANGILSSLQRTIAEALKNQFSLPK